MQKEMDYESLSNAEIRELCKKNNFPNVPVLDSNRKILIKRLRALDTPGQADAKKTNRRETIHVSKVPSEAVTPSKSDVVNKTNRQGRRTIAVLDNAEETPKDKVKEASQPPPVSTRRRSIKEPSSERGKPLKTVEEMPTIIVETDEEDEDLIISAEKAKRIPSIKTQSDKPGGRASESMPKSKAVPMVLVQEDMPISEGGISIAAMESRYPSAPKYETKVNVTSKIQTSSVLPPLTSKSLGGIEQKARAGTNSSVLDSLKTTPAPSHAELESAAKVSNPFSEGINRFRKPVQFQRKTDSFSPSVRRSVPAVSETYSSIALRNRYYYNENSDEAADGNGDGLEDEVEIYETPFLSNFARKLEMLKSENIDKNSSKFGTGRNITSSDILQRSPYHATSRRFGEFDEDLDISLGATFRNIFRAFQRKYGFKLYFAIIMFFVFILFLYSIFTP